MSRKLSALSVFCFLSAICSFHVLSQESVIKAARAELNNGNVKSAIDMLNQAGSDHPKSADVQYWLAVSYSKNGQFNEALLTARKAFDLKPGHLLNRSLLLDLLLKKEDFENAKKEADFLIKESPKDPSFKLKLAECLIGLNEFEKASIELSKLEVQSGLSQSVRVNVWLLLGDVYAKQRVNATAIGYYQKALNADPNSAGTRLKLGKLYFREQQYSEALKEYLEAVRLDSNSREGNLNVGYIYYNGGKSNPQQYGNAIYYLQKYVLLEPQDYQGYLYIGKSFHALRSYKNAIDPLVKSAELDTGKTRDETLRLLAESYSGAGDHPKVVQTYEYLVQREVALDGKDFARLGLSYKALRDTANTVKYFERAAVTDPTLNGLYQDLGTMYYSAKRFSEAIKWFEKRAISGPSDSTMATVWQNLGLSQLYAARVKTDTVNALSSLRKAVELKPYSLSHWLVLAQVSERADSIDLAKNAYTYVLAQDSFSVQSYFGLASISYRQKKNDEAIRCFLKVITLDDKHKAAPYYLAQSYLRLKKNSTAIPYLKRCLELDPAGPFAADCKRILKQLGAN